MYSSHFDNAKIGFTNEDCVNCESRFFAFRLLKKEEELSASNK